MIFYKKGELLKCDSCGEPIYYVKDDIDTNEKLDYINYKLLPIGNQKPINNNFPNCNKCGWNLLDTMLNEADKKTKIKGYNFKKFKWKDVIPDYSKFKDIFNFSGD